jgi:hypothetical protein
LYEKPKLPYKVLKRQHSCDHATMRPCDHATMRPCDHATKLILILWISTFSSFLFAQYDIPPNLNENEDPSKSFYFYENKGQLLDLNGVIRNDISYYNINNSVNLFLSLEGTIAYNWSIEDTKTLDTELFRIDMERNNPETEVSLIAMGQSDNYLNFFYPHCPKGATGVRGYERIIYLDYYSNIDYHITSNQSGIKHMYVIKPGGNPNNIELKFSGQDSLINTVANLEMYLEGEMIILPNAIAYEVTNTGQVVPSNWIPSFIMLNTEVVKFNVGNYNPNNTLVIVQAPPIGPAGPTNNNQWSTYIGGQNADDANGIDMDDNGNAYVVGGTRSIATGSGAFMPSPGNFTNIYQAFNKGLEDAYVIKFDSTDNEVWATYIGGAGEDRGEKIVLDNSGNIFIIGDTKSSNFISSCAVTGGTCASYSGGQDIFITKLQNNGQGVIWSTYYGGTSDENAVDIDLSPNDNVFVAFNTYSSDCSIKTKTGSYNDALYNGDGDGFLSIFNNDGIQDWASYFGSDKIDHLGGLTVGLDRFFIHGDTGFPIEGNVPCGVPTNGGFPLCDVTGNNDFFDNSSTNHSGSGRGFVTEFSDVGVMKWSTFFGFGIDAGSDGTSTTANGGGIVVYQTEVELNLYITGAIEEGVSTTNSCSTVTNGNYPLCGGPNNVTVQGPSGVSGGYDLYIARFGKNRDLQWSTCFGGPAGREFGVTIDVNDNGIFVVGGAAWGSQVSISNTGLYNQQFQLGNQDPLLLAYDFVTLQPIWATYYGGNDPSISGPAWPIEDATDLISFNNQLYMVGLGYSTDFPFNCDDNVNFCRDIWDYQSNHINDGFITRFDLTNLYSSTNSLYIPNQIQVYPNPTSGILNVDLQGKELDKLFIYNSLGQLIQVVENNILEDQSSIDVSHFPNGFYFIVIQSGQQLYSTKFTKH